MRLTPRSSIKQKKIFSRILKSGHKQVCDGVVLCSLSEQSNKVSELEYGIIASKKSFKKAVDRNFAKRRIRELIRSAKTSRPLQLVFIARTRLITMKFDKLRADFENLLKHC